MMTLEITEYECRRSSVVSGYDANGTQLSAHLAYNWYEGVWQCWGVDAPTELDSELQDAAVELCGKRDDAEDAVADENAAAERAEAEADGF